MNDSKFASIKLNRCHTPIHPNCLIRNQEQYDNHEAMLNYLYQQIDFGFQPKWMISLHYFHPSERHKNVPEMYKGSDGLPRTRWGRKIIRKGEYNYQSSLWNEVAEYNHNDNRRNDKDLTEKDNSQIKKLMLKYLYKISRFNQTWKPNFPKNMLFIMEKGKAKLQYHLHVLLPKISKDLNTEEDIRKMLNSNREKARCLSKWKRIDVKEIDNPHKSVSYLNKETTGTHCSLDFKNSILLTR